MMLKPQGGPKPMIGGPRPFQGSPNTLPGMSVPAPTIPRPTQPLHPGQPMAVGPMSGANSPLANDTGPFNIQPGVGAGTSFASLFGSPTQPPMGPQTGAPRPMPPRTRQQMLGAALGRMQRY